LPMQNPGAPDTTLLRMRSAPSGMCVMRRRASVHLGAGRLHPFVQDGERARIGVDRHTERLCHAVGGDVTLSASRRQSAITSSHIAATSTNSGLALSSRSASHVTIARSGSSAAERRRAGAAARPPPAGSVDGFHWVSPKPYGTETSLTEKAIGYGSPAAAGSPQSPCRAAPP
jgi:hypothetical protein